MFTLKELELLRKVLDYYPELDAEEFNDVMNIRDKVTDLMVLKKQWNKKLNLCDM